MLYLAFYMQLQLLSDTVNIFFSYENIQNHTQTTYTQSHAFISFL